MTGAVKWAWEHRTLVLLGLVILLVALLASTCRRAASAEHAVEAAKERAEQEAQVRKANVPVIQQIPPVAMTEEEQRILAAYPALKADRDRLAQAIGKLKATIAISAETEVMHANAPERPAEPAPGVVAPAVILRAGDGVKAALAGLGYEGDKGAEALLLSIGIVRVSDGAEIGRAPLSVLLSRIYDTAPSPRACATVPDRAWRLGPAGGATGQGWIAGAAGIYRFDFLWKPEVMATINAGPGGVVALGSIMF